MDKPLEELVREQQLKLREQAAALYSKAITDLKELGFDVVYGVRVDGTGLVEGFADLRYVGKRT